MTHTSPAETALADSNQPQPRSDPWWKSTRSIAIAGLVIAVIATAVAIAAWLRPQGPSFSSQQSASAKANVCAAYSTSSKALFMKHPQPKPGDVVAGHWITSNERMALLGAGAYLRQTTAAEPAAPADLLKAVNSMGETLQRMGLDYIAGADKSVWEPLRKDLGSETFQINNLCK